MKLSIIVPVYNVEPYLRRCVDSILCQTFSDFELILVDDGSPDNCPDICDKYAETDSRVKVIHKKNGGLSDARNAGISVAVGDYLGFVDSDDSISENMYERLLNMAQLNNADIVACGILNISQEGEVFGHWPNLSEDIVYYRRDFINNLYPDVRRNIMPSVANKIFRRDIFDKIKFPIGRIYEDAQIQLEIYDQCNVIAVCHEHLYHYYFNRPGSINNCTYSAKQFDMLLFSLKNYHFYVANEEMLQQQYTLEVYMNNYLKNYFQVNLFNRDLKKQFLVHQKVFHKYAYQAIQNPLLCKLKRVTLLLSFFSPGLAYKVCKKYFPECVYDSTN